jgi:molybdenum cofactor cytidylyltransferase
MAGEPKLLGDLCGKSVVRWVVEAALASRTGEVLVVCGAVGGRVRRSLAGLPIRIVENPRFDRGMSTSLRLGIDTVCSKAKGALILLGDQPMVTSDMLDRIIGRFENDAVRIVASRYGDWQGTPVLFHRDLFPELARLRGDRGAKSVVKAHPHQVALIDFPPHLAADIDTDADLERAREALCKGASADR